MINKTFTFEEVWYFLRDGWVGCTDILISSRMYSKLGKIIAQKIIPPTKKKGKNGTWMLQLPANKNRGIIPEWKKW